MRNRSSITLFVVLLAVTCVAFLTSRPHAEDEETSAIPKWEYKKIDDPSDEYLTRIGNQGWEAYAVVEYPNGVAHMYFKRAKK